MKIMPEEINKKSFVFGAVTGIIALILMIIGGGGVIYLLHMNNADYSYLDNNQYTQRQGLFEIIPPAKVDIIFLGDSITQRCEWQELFPEYNVQNRGIGSDISEGVLNRLDVIYAAEPKIIFLMIGVNDISKGVSVSEYVANYREIISNIQWHTPNSSVYVQSILPAKSIPSLKTEEWNSCLKTLCDELNVQYIDIYSLFIDEGRTVNGDLISNDGVHLTGIGYKVWADVLKTYLR